MKKVLLFCISFTLLFSMPSLGQQKEGKQSNGNNDNGRVNLLLPHGNIGINTLSPSERLEVIGNVRISNALFVKESDMTSLTTTTLSVREDVAVGRNLFINGNVGIGIQEPTERLEIAGNLRVTQKIYADEAEVNAFTGNNGTINQNFVVGENFTVNGLTGLGITAPTERLEIAGNIKITENVISNGILAETGEFTSTLAVQENLLVSGNSGFGVDSPTEKLEVAGNIKSSGSFLGQELEVEKGSFIRDVQIGQSLTVAGNADFTGSVGMQSLNISGSLESTSFQAGNGNFSGSFSAAGPVALDSTVLIKGTVGIGTEKTEGYALSVNGKIRAGDDIRVYPSVEWADYVFADSYHLPTLQEVESFLLTNKHLPEIPSATEVKEEGIELGEMDAKLLQKIEELTLYTIAQEKVLIQQKQLFEQKDKEIKELRSELEDLKAMFKKLLEE